MPSMVSVCRRVIMSDLSRRVRPSCAWVRTSCAWVRTSCEWVRTSDLPRPKSKHILFPHCRLTARPSPVHRTGLTPRSRTEAACTGAERPHPRTSAGVWALTWYRIQFRFLQPSTTMAVLTRLTEFHLDHSVSARSSTTRPRSFNRCSRTSTSR